MKLNLVKTHEEAPGVISFIFMPIKKMTWKAGQYLHYTLHHEPTDERGSDRWFTISSASFEHEVVITTRIAEEKGSSFKKALMALKVGESIEATEAEGDIILEDVSKEYVFIAGGIGITPFRAILKELEHQKKSMKCTLLYANRDENIAFKEEFEGMAKKNPSLKIRYVISPERLDEKKIREFVPDLGKPIFYVSGPEPMVEALGKTLKDMGVPADHLKQDWFPGYPAE